MATKILFQISAEDLGVATKLEAIRDRQKEINAAIRDAKKIGNPYDGLIKDLAQTRVEAGKLREEQRNLNKEFKAAQFPKDSVIGMRVEYQKLTDQINKLSAAERNSDFGKNLIKRASGIKGEIDKVEQSIGRFTGNVGNYRSALNGIGDAITGGLVTGGVVAGVAAIGKVFQIGINQAIEYEKALDDLSALTGVSGAQLEGFKAIEKELRNIKVGAEQVVSTGPEILNALKLVGGARPELLQNAAALGEVSKQAIILSRASGDDLDTSVRAITSSLAQFGLEASDSSKIINLLAAGSKEGKVEIRGLTDSLTRLGPSAKNSNVSLAESIAVFENLANSGLEGERAAVQLRNVLITLSAAKALPKEAQQQFKRFGVDVDILSNKNLTLGERLKELEKIGGDVTAMFKIFGKENIDAALILAQTTPDYDRLLESIQGTNEALAQAEIRAGNVTTAVQNLKNTALNSLQEEFEGTTSTGSDLLKVLTSITEGFTLFGEKINAVSVITDIAIGPLGAGLSRLRGFFTSDESKKGLLGLDLGELRKTIDLTTGELIPAIDDTVQAQKDSVAASLAAAAALGEGASAGKGKGKGKDKDFGAAGSLSFLREEVSKLQKQIDTTSADSPLLKGLLDDLKKVEIALSVAQAKINALKNPAGPDVSEFDQGNAGLLTLGGISQSDADKLKTDLQKLASNLAASVGIVLPVTVDVDGADDALFELQRKQNAIDDKGTAERLEKREQDREEMVNEALNTASTIAGGVSQIQQNAVAAEQTLAQQALDAKLAKDLLKAKGNAKKEAAIRADYEKRKIALEKESAEKRKKIAKVEAVIQGALAVIRALAVGNFILAAAAALATGVQVAVINSQQFAAGGQVTRQKSGMIKQQANAPSTAGGDNILAYLQNKEVVLNRAQQHRLQQRAGRSILADIGVPGINITNAPRLVSGGAIDFIPQAGFRSSFEAANREAGLSIQSVAEFSDSQTRQLGSTLGVLIAGEVSKQVRIALGQGLNDANRRLEREASLETNRRG